MKLSDRIARLYGTFFGNDEAAVNQPRHDRPIFDLQALERRLFLSASPVISGDSSVHAGDNYTLNLASNESGPGIDHWSVNWGDGDTDTISGDPSSATHVYTTAGVTDTIHASVTENGTCSGYGDGYGDGYGGGSGTPGDSFDSNSQDVDILQPLPTAYVGAASSTREAGVAFSAAVSTTGLPSSVSIDWGDGNTTTLNASDYGGTLPNPAIASHTFTSAATYTISATATNSSGTSSASTMSVVISTGSDVPIINQVGAKSSGSVEVDWTAGPSTPSGTTYSIYRSTNSTLPGSPIVSGLTSTSWTDTSSSLSAGASYVYWVHATEPSGPGSLTDPIPITIPTGDHKETFFMPIYLPAAVTNDFPDALSTIYIRSFVVAGGTNAEAHFTSTLTGWIVPPFNASLDVWEYTGTPQYGARFLDLTANHDNPAVSVGPITVGAGINGEMSVFSIWMHLRDPYEVEAGLGNISGIYDETFTIP